MRSCGHNDVGVDDGDNPVTGHTTTDTRTCAVVGIDIDVLVDDLFQQLPGVAEGLVVGGRVEHLPGNSHQTAQLGSVPRRFFYDAIAMVGTG